MRKDVFEKYYRAMVSIINYKEKDENGNERKCTVSVKEAEKNPERYTIYECKDEKLKKYKFAYDRELVKKQADRLREICKIVPQQKLLQSHKAIWARFLLNDENPNPKDLILAETFLAMAESCGIVSMFPNMPAAKAVMRENIRSSYKENSSHDEK